ncbi:hypothetical protein PoB_007590400, partial [Plakobranchus ocellatus]
SAHALYIRTATYHQGCSVCPDSKLVRGAENTPTSATECKERHCEHYGACSDLATGRPARL